MHIVTLLEEMPVQETVDAAIELSAAGFAMGTIVVNRARPTLIADGQVGPDGSVDLDLLVAGLHEAGLPDGYAGALAAQMADYVQRQELQEDTTRRLDEVALPRVELPDLNPPVELGELNELAHCFLVGGGQ